jgi:hypothetical protein
MTLPTDLGRAFHWYVGWRRQVSRVADVRVDSDATPYRWDSATDPAFRDRAEVLFGGARSVTVSAPLTRKRRGSLPAREPSSVSAPMRASLSQRVEA